MIGAILFMGIVKLPTRGMYWQEATRVPLISESITANRFNEIICMIHFNDNSIIDDNETNCMFKIQPFVDALKHNFRFTVLPDTCMAVDEQMIPCKGRNGLRQYLTKKPKKWGYKLCALAGVSGCVYNFEVDGSPESKGLPENTNHPSKRGKSNFAVMRLTKGLEKNEHFVFYDNYFSLCT